MKLLEKAQLYLIPVASLLVVVALIPWVIMPQLNRITSANKSIQKDQSRLSVVKTKADKLDKLAENETDLNNNLQFVESVLPIEKAIASLVVGVQQIAKDNGLQVIRLRLAPGKTATSSAKTAASKLDTTNNQAANSGIFSSKDSLVFELKLSGKINDFKNYLATLERAKRILFLNRFDAQQSPNGFDVTFFINAPYGQLPLISPDQIAQQLKELSSSNQKLLDDLKSGQFQDVTNVQIEEVPTGVENPFINSIP